MLFYSVCRTFQIFCRVSEVLIVDIYSFANACTGGFLFFRIFSVAISVSPHVCFILALILSYMFLRECTYELGTFHANQTT